jgi:RIO kinase 1
VEPSPEQAREFHQFLIRQIVRMLCTGLIHGDLSEYNILIDASGPVIIDLPQAVNASGNNNALAMLERDVGNITTRLARFAPELAQTNYAQELWALFAAGELKPDTMLTGSFVKDEAPTDPDAVMLAIDDAREEAIRRQLGRLQGQEKNG